MKPRIIHQIFFEVGTKKLEDYPLFVENRDKWKVWCERNNYEYMFHTLEDLEPIMKQEDKDLFKRVDDENRFKFIKIDYGRLVILSHYGGVYVDMDVCPKLDKELDNLLMKYEPFVVMNKNKKDKLELSGWFLGCDKGGLDGLMKYCRDTYESKSKMKNYDNWKIRFATIVCGGRAIRNYYKKTSLNIMTEDIYDYVANTNQLSWLNDDFTKKQKPRIIHQVFFEVGNKKLEDYPLFVENRDKWKVWCERNNYEYMFHTLEDLEPIMKQEDKDLFKRVDDENRFQFIKIDYGRMVILSHYGGVYLDMDVAPLLDKPLDDLIMKYEPLVVVNKSERYNGKLCFNCWFMACEKGGFSDLLEYFRGQYEEKAKNPIYDKWKIRFYLQTCSVPCIMRWAKQQVKENKLLFMTEDIDKYLLESGTRSWINDKDGFK